MLVPRTLCYAFVISLFCVSLAAQQPAATPTPAPSQRDPQAVALVQRAVIAMGGAAPSDSTATGTVTIVAGSKTSTGTIHVLTRGTSQTAEQITADAETSSVTFSDGLAATDVGSGPTQLPLEATYTRRSAIFPLPLLAGMLSNPDTACQYLGADSVGGAQAQHVRVWDTFASTPYLRTISEYTAFDFWFDPSSGLPLKASYEQRDAGGSAPKLLMDLQYSDWKSLGSIKYPSSVLKSVNGTPWITITLQKVQLQTGLTDNNFPVGQTPEVQ